MRIDDGEWNQGQKNSLTYPVSPIARVVAVSFAVKVLHHAAGSNGLKEASSSKGTWLRTEAEDRSTSSSGQPPSL